MAAPNHPEYDHVSPSREPGRSRLPSPRIEHFDGEIPPALSPLDAFAAQGRLLARELDESRRRDRRLSRLPPANVMRSLSQPRPGYFRSPSSGDSVSQHHRIARRPTQKTSPEIETPKFRPQSEHPRLSGVSIARSDSGSFYDGDDISINKPSGSDYAEFPSTESPVEDQTMLQMGVDETHGHRSCAPVGVALPGPSSSYSSTDSVSHLNVPRGLAPPGSPLSRPSSGARATNPDSSDDDYSSSNGGSTFSQPRKLSSSSALSLPHSPMSSAPQRSHRRSPSGNSETSTSGYHLPRPSFNFSRPLSRASAAHLPTSAPTPHPVPAGQPGRMNRAHKPSPIVVPSTSEAGSITGEPWSAVSEFAYHPRILPRGREVSRDSVVFSGTQAPHSERQEPILESTGPPVSSMALSERPTAVRSPSPPIRQDTDDSLNAGPIQESPATNKQRDMVEASSPPRVPSPASSKVDQLERRSTEETANLSSVASKHDDKYETTSSADSASTVRPQSAAAPNAASSTSTVLTAEDHVALGIECHEKGSLNESTYHLRIAAKQNDPTGMLLYALACRHGWGMRPNQREGVRWLRKALDCVGVELLTDKANNASGRSRAQDMVQKTHRAQFALSVYELGVSHLNGWGIEQDKALALRCFEIAAQWGDADAMAEAGFCYVQGIGCKKDMKKAAKFYRMAEAKGMSMVGNSWYVQFFVFGLWYW